MTTPADILPDWLARWWRGGDNGLSSRYLAACLSDSDALYQTTERGYPHDTSDVGRCVRLLDLAATNGLDWRAAMPGCVRLVYLSPQWSMLLPRWPEIEAAYREDEANQKAWNAAHPRHREYMRGKSQRAIAHNAVRATFPPSRCWWLAATIANRYDPYNDRQPHPFAAAGKAGL